MKKINRKVIFLRFFKYIAVVIVFTLAINLFSNYVFLPFTLSISFSDSLECDIFLIDKKDKSSSFKVNDTILFLPPKTPFFPEGYKFIKIIKGISGDHLTFNQENEFFINNKKLGRTKSHSQSGKKLQANNSQTILDGFYFVWTPHKDSFDSRYKHVGLIHESQIKGHAHCLADIF